MSTPSRLRRSARALGLVAALGMLAWTSSAGQPHVFEGLHRIMVQEVGLPGIDRGLRSQDAPRDPVGPDHRLRSTIARAGGPAGNRVYRPGSVIVKFRDGTARASTASAMVGANGLSLNRPPYANFEIMAIPPDADPEVVSEALRQRPEVEYAQPRYINHPMQAPPNDPFFDQQWNFPAIDMVRAWEIQPAAGDQIIVAVLDTGIAFRTATVSFASLFPFRLEPGGPLFPALGVVDVPFAVAPELGNGKFVGPRDFIWEDDLPFDLDGHGTHVSGTIGQLTNNGVGVAGMAYNVRLMPVKVIDEVWDFIFNSPNIGTDDVIARGIRYAADNGAKVINMSIGRTEGGPARVTDDAIRYAVSRGVFVAVAAGNSGHQGNAPSRTAESAPAIPGMVAVGAVGRTLDRAFYSTQDAYVELAAPGGDQRRSGLAGGILQQTLDDDLLHTYLDGPERLTPPRADAFVYSHFQGTSMATSHVSALAALLMQQGITSPAAIEAAMKQFARDLGPAGVDPEFGHGLIQPRPTLRGLGLAR